ncbi:MAG: methylmalonyl Co-A mutase-associated GTPase MeaB [Kordiimonadaceae bacterium]|jgi:LAO/AO transport system kinase|nr:methylmalonyl Co-A mutase-associated GTPase MeaB [Kordiimonadaceae bacterium]
MDDFVERIISGNRRDLAKAITLIESSRADHQEQAQELLAELLPHAGKTIRIGLTGIPGVGKSTFIETFGKMLTAQGIKVAVLAVDPSSKISGGSILGDKTRMEELARDPLAFIRPSPSQCTLGGIARHTRDAMLILEAAGFDVIIIETVGVGQSEVAVSDLVDMFLLLLSPGGGDELQGIKRGIMEIADLVVVNKADGDFINAARIAASDCENALHLMQPKSKNWTVNVLQASALNNIGLEEVWQNIQSYKATMLEHGEFESRRDQQNIAAVWSEVNEIMIDHLKQQKFDKIDAVERAVKNKKITASAAARELLSSVLD